MNSATVVLLFFTLPITLTHGDLTKLLPGHIAPSFSLQTLKGRRAYVKRDDKTKTPQHPVIFHAFTRRSAFIEALWTDSHSLTGLLQNSPWNTRYVFMSFSETAKEDAKWMKDLVYHAVDQFYSHKQNNSSAHCKHYHNNHIESPGSTKKKHKYDATSREKQAFYTLAEIKELRKNHGHHSNKTRPTKACEKYSADQWKKRLYFVDIPVFELGNWIPYVLNHWQCFGTSCALPQIAIKSTSGDVVRVIERLDARYDWLPSPHGLAYKHKRLSLKYFGDACEELSKDQKHREHGKQNDKHKKDHKKTKPIGTVALVSASGNCSLFKKIVHMSRAKVDAVLIYQEYNQSIQELTCNGKHCYFPLRIPASMIRHNDGISIRDKLLAGQELFALYQSTPQENFFFAIDGQGKLAEVGLFLYPSMMFMAYEAKWFNYKTDLIHNLTGSARIIHVFNHTMMKGHKGAVTTIKLPPIKDLLLYRNVELDMTLHCAGTSDFDCPHWDHVVYLTVCCDESSPLCGEELGRWITPYRRGVGRWLTRITPLLPLFTSERCTLRMRHPFWERAWKPSLDIRFSDHIHYSRHHYSGQHEDEFIVPYKAIKLYHGGTFDKQYNTHYKPVKFEIPPKTQRVKLVATITGHGSDNNACAEFCVTSHHFLINGKPNVRVFKNAAKAMGCANRVAQGVAPNEHGTWLYGRDGWCCGQEVVPWVVDVTNQIHRTKLNTIKYFGWFNGTDPRPTRNAGNIIMSSFLVFYISSDDLDRNTNDFF